MNKSPAPKIVTVIGGTGFLGRQIVRRLARGGFRIRVTSRHPSLAHSIIPLGDVGQIAIVRADIGKEHEIAKAVEGAARAAREKVLAAASQELEIAPDDLEVVDGVVRAIGAPDRSITVEEIAGKALRFGGIYEPIEGHGGSAQTKGAPSVAAHLSHVRVDRETGEVELLRHVIAQDVGRALNPALVEGQMRGGATQGMGWALFEQLDHDEDGHLLTGSFLDYAIPVAERVPEIETLIVEVPAPDGPFGAKGIGEAPVIGAAPAIANAVAAAVGVRLRELPMTPPRVWQALREPPGAAETPGIDLAT